MPLILQERSGIFKIGFFLALGLSSFTVKADGPGGAGDSVRIQYGQHGELFYNLKKGTFSVYSDHRLIFSDVAGLVKGDGLLLSSAAYALPELKAEGVQ